MKCMNINTENKEEKISLYASKIFEASFQKFRLYSEAKQSLLTQEIA